MKTAVFLVVVLAAFNLAARSTDINTAGKIFLVEPGARALGIAGCGTLLGESYSGLYNPAAQALTYDVNASVYLNPEPYFGPTYDFMAFSLGARSEFGYIGFSYMFRGGIDEVGTFYPPEDATAVVIAGRPSEKFGLALGVAFKILITEQRKAAAIAVNESQLDLFKMAFDLGAVYAGLLPQLTLGEREMDWVEGADLYPWKPTRGIAVGVAFQNLGGKVEYEDSIEEYPLPQTFRADLLWKVYMSPHWNLLAAGQLQKLLVGLNEKGGYMKATEAFFQAWGGGQGEGGWTARLGFELSAFGLTATRLGWSKNHNSRRSFIYYGLGAGPEWLRFNIVWENEPDGVKSTSEELRYALTAGLSYEMLRNLIHGSDY